MLNLPPPWRRSLTESGMRRRVTRGDRVVIALFLVALVAVVVWIASVGLTPGTA